MYRKSTTTVALLLINLQYLVCATNHIQFSDNENSAFTKHLSTDLSCAQECNGQPYGYMIQDPYDCTGYLLCQGSVITQKYCESGYIFSMIVQKCIQGKCPPCVHITPPPPTLPTTIIPPPTVPPPSTIPSTITPPPCTNPPITSPSTIAPPPCTNPPITAPPTTVMPPCVDPNFINCTKFENGYRFPDNMHCRFFWQCVNNRAVRLFCEKGMWYDREHYVCNFPFMIKSCPANQD